MKAGKASATARLIAAATVLCARPGDRRPGCARGGGLVRGVPVDLAGGPLAAGELPVGGGPGGVEASGAGDASRDRPALDVAQAVDRIAGPGDDRGRGVAGRGASPCSKVRDVTRWGVGPGFSISHYITVSDPSGGAGGRGLLILSDLSTRRASGDPAEMPDRGFCPSRRNVT